MASPSRSQFSPLVVLAVFLALWWLLPVVVHVWVRTGFYDFEAPAWLAYARVGEIQQFWGLRAQDPINLIEGGRDLARQNAAQTLLLQQATSSQEEIRRLEDLLRLPNEAQFRYEIARVIRRDQTAWWQQITLGKGRNAGVEPGQGVVYAGGVVGRIKEVYATTAIVELVSSPGFRVAANLSDDPRPIIYRGAKTPPFGAAIGEAHDVPLDIGLPASGPLRVVSSSLNGVFPQGLTIGWIDEMEPGNDGLFKSGPVRLDARLSALREVAVLVPITMPPPTRPTPTR